MTLPALRHPDAEIRRQCIASLSGTDVDHERDALLALLDDPDWRVRREVALAIARASDVRGSVVPLVESVERGDVARRNAAMEALRQIGRSVAPVLLARLTVVEANARRFLVELLADVGDESAVGPLEQLLSGDDANVAHAAAESLARISAPSAERALVRALDNPEAVVRLAVLQAFAARRRALQWSLVEPLISDPICRRAALLAAALCAESAALDAILRALIAGGPLVSAAVLALAQRLDSGIDADARDKMLAVGAPSVLIDVADHGTSPDARRAALKCLRTTPVPEAIAVVLASVDLPETASVAEGVVDAFGPEAVDVALRCAPALGRAGVVALLRWSDGRVPDNSANALVAIAERWLDGGVRSIALWETVASRGDRASAERLVARICSRAATLDSQEIASSIERVVQRFPEVAAGLASVPVQSTLGVVIATSMARAGLAVDELALRDALGSQDARLRAGALRALSIVDPRRTLDALAFALADEDPTVQTAAAEVLGQRGDGREMLVASLGASDPRVRRAAVWAVARWSDGISRVRPLLDDPEPAVVLGTMEALGDSLRTSDLERLCSHADADVVTQALASLRHSDPSRAATMAERLLSHAIWSVRLEAVRALVGAGPAARERLERARNAERDELVVEAIDAALSHNEGGR
ncbi:MAG: HEAT repeat domain-containing protein [Myxococcales bacterium]|nr:HEAT repeat domain-containing protein [Myxococcales bacterium]